MRILHAIEGKRYKLKKSLYLATPLTSTYRFLFPLVLLAPLESSRKSGGKSTGMLTRISFTTLGSEGMKMEQINLIFSFCHGKSVLALALQSVVYDGPEHRLEVSGDPELQCDYGEGGAADGDAGGTNTADDGGGAEAHARVRVGAQVRENLLQKTASQVNYMSI